MVDIDVSEIVKQISDGAIESIVNNMPRIIEASKPVIDQITGNAATAMAEGFNSGVQTGSDALKGLKKDAADNLKSAFTTVEGMLKRMGKKANIDLDFSDVDLSNLNEKIGQVKEVIKKSGVETISSVIGVDAGELLKGINEIENALDPLADLETLAVGFIGVKAINQAKKYRDAVANIEGTIMAVDRAAVNMSRGFVVFGKEGPASFQNTQQAIEQYRQEALGFVTSTGKSLEEYAAFTDELNKSNLSFKTVRDGMKDFSASMGEGEKPVSGFEAVLAIAKGTGLETKDVLGDLATFTKTLGLTADEAAKRYGLFSEVIKGTQLNAREAREAIMGNVKQLRFYGDQSQSTSRIYKNFLNALGTGKEALAGELLGVATKALAGMDDNIKAFLGTVGGIGGGAGGALGGALRVEQAIEEGRTDEIFRSMAEQLEKFSGAPLLTMKEALESGNEQQFFIQKQLLKQMGVNVSTNKEASEFIKGLREGQDMQLEIDQEAGIRAVTGAGREAMAAEVGPAERIANLAEATATLGLTEDVSKRMIESSTLMGDASGTLEKGANALLDVANKLKERFRISIADEATDPGIKVSGADELRAVRSEAAATGEEATQELRKARQEASGSLEDLRQQRQEAATTIETVREAVTDTTTEAAAAMPAARPPEPSAPTGPEAVREQVGAAPTPAPTPTGGMDPEAKAAVTEAITEAAPAAAAAAEPTVTPEVTETQIQEMAETSASTKAFQDAIQKLTEIMTNFEARREEGVPEPVVNVTVKIGEQELRNVTSTVAREYVKAAQKGTKGQQNGSLLA